MHANIATKLAVALESGKYEQGTGYLCKDGKYCCLGVLCELAVAEGITTREGDVPVGGGTSTAVEYGRTGETAFMPREVMEWAGVKQPNGVLGLNGISLVDLNDYGMPFSGIAKILRNNAGTIL